MNNVQMRYLKEDLRPAFVLDDVKEAEFHYIDAQIAPKVRAPGLPTFMLKNLEDFNTCLCSSVPDTQLEQVKQENLYTPKAY
jgi:hypothetical protein